MSESIFRRHTIAFATAAIGLSEFAGRLIQHARAGQPLDDSALAEIKAACIQDAKNVEGRGMPLDEEAATLGESVQVLNHFIDCALTKGRQIEDS